MSASCVSMANNLMTDAGNYGKWTEKCGKIFLFSHNYPEYQVKKN